MSEAREILRNAEKESILLGDTLQVYIGSNLESERLRDIDKALKAGHTVKRSGSRPRGEARPAEPEVALTVKDSDSA